MRPALGVRPMEGEPRVQADSASSLARGCWARAYLSHHHYFPVTLGHENKHEQLPSQPGPPQNHSHHIGEARGQEKLVSERCLEKPPRSLLTGFSLKLAHQDGSRGAERRRGWPRCRGGLSVSDRAREAGRTDPSACSGNVGGMGVIPLDSVRTWSTWEHHL